MTRTFSTMLGVLGVLGAGCSDGSTGATTPLTCAWLDGDNCWKTTVAMAATCLPPPTERGVLSADNKTCTYASGSMITFTPALVLPIRTGTPWNLTISNGGVECLHYEATPSSQKLVVAGQTVSQRSRNLDIHITCPDDETYFAANAQPLLSCGAATGAIFGGLPGYTQTSSDDSLVFGLIGSEPGQLFYCEK